MGLVGSHCVLSFPFSTPGVLACDDSTADEAGTSLGLEGGGPWTPYPRFQCPLSSNLRRSRGHSGVRKDALKGVTLEVLKKD